MTGSLSLSARLSGLLAAMLVLGSILAAGLNYLKFERLLLEQQARVLTILADELGVTLENALQLGVRLPGVPGAQALLERSRAAEPRIGGLSIVDAAGIVLFDTDRQNVNRPAAVAAMSGAGAPGGAWRYRDGDRYGIGTPVTNGFGQREGAILLSYDRRAVDARLTAVLLAMTEAILLALAIALPLGAVLIHLLTRPARRWFAAMEAAMRPGAPPDPLAASLQQAVAQADTVLGAAEARLDAIAADLPGDTRA